MSDLVEVDCPSCGTRYALTRQYAAWMRTYDKRTACPNGHSWSWTKSDLDRANEQIERLKKDIAFISDERDRYIESYQDADAHLVAAERSNAALRGQITKLRKRLETRP